MNLQVRPDGSVHVSVSRRVLRLPRTTSCAAAPIGSAAGGTRCEASLAPPDGSGAACAAEFSLERMWPLVEPLGVKKARS